MKKATPSVFQILAKTHRLTVFLSAPVTATIADLKTQVLPALEQYSSTENNTEMYDDIPIAIPGNEPIPKVKDVADFEFCSAKRDRLGRVTEYNVLDPELIIRGNLSNWEALYFRFRNESGKLQDVQVEEPIDPDEVDVPDPKGKRKEHPT